MEKQVFLTKLRRARDLIQSGWTQGEDARDAEGHPTYLENDGATCWCMVGALVRAGIPRSQFEFEYPNGESESVLFWNDEPKRTKAEVLACFDNSIAALESELTA